MGKQINVAVCCATIRPEMCIEMFKSLFKKDNLDDYCLFPYVMIDNMNNKDKEMLISSLKDLCYRPQVFNHNDVEKELKENSWIIPTKTSACRSFAILKAYQNKDIDYVFTIDDDCLVEEDIIKTYLKDFKTKYTIIPYFDTSKFIHPRVSYMRGFPYIGRFESECVAQYGMWNNVPDLDGKTQAQLNKRNEYRVEYGVPEAIPKYQAATTCNMNSIFRRDYIPACYHLIMGMEKYGFDRFDDMWMGLFIKKIADHLGHAVVINPSANVIHTRASSVEHAVAAEMGGLNRNEHLWEYLLKCNLSSGTVLECYMEISDIISDLGQILDDQYYKDLGRAMFAWSVYCEDVK